MVDSFSKSYFKPQEALIFRIVRSPIARVMKSGRKLGHFFLLLALLVSFFIGYQVIIQGLEFKSWLGGAALVLLMFGVFFYKASFFFGVRLIYPRLKIPLKRAASSGNLASFLDYETARLLRQIFRQTPGRAENIPATVLNLLFLKKIPIINFAFYRLGLNPQDFAAEWKKEGKEKEELIPNLESIIQAAARRAIKKEQPRIRLSDLLAAVARFDPFFSQVLIEHGLESEDWIEVLEWYERLYQTRKSQKKFWKLDNLMRKGSLATNWAAAYTLTIDRYSTNWTREAQLQGRHLEILGHQKELTQIENILAKSGMNNVLLVGEPGSGRRDITLALASKSFWGATIPSLSKKRILELDIGAMVNEISSLEKLELTLEQCFKEAITAGNVILVINNLENYLGGETAGAIDISSTLARYLHSSRFQVIALASYQGLHQKVEQKPSMLNLFSKVEVEPLTANQTLKLLEFYLPQFEARYRQFILYPTLKKIVSHSARYLQEKPFPQKALDLLDEIIIYVHHSFPKERIIWPSYVDQVITQKTQIPVGGIIASERETLVNLETLLHQSIINQEEAIQNIASALRRARTEVTAEREKPMGSFLFLGPTGVGKTETAKALARVYFGSEERIIRMDMAEFQKIEDIYRFIGDQDRPGLLTSQVRENPFSLVLLDEIEKAHPDILNLFLTVLDEGYLTDSWGRKISFSDTVIIGTSNAGANLIWEDIQKDKELNMVREDLLRYFLDQNIFRPEFLNRFDAVVIFRPLTEENLRAIVRLKLKKLKESLKKAKKIELVITEDLVAKVAQLGYEPAFGARAMNRVIRNRVENALAKAILTQEINRGDKVEVNAETFNIRQVP